MMGLTSPSGSLHVRFHNDNPLRDLEGSCRQWSGAKIQGGSARWDSALIGQFSAVGISLLGRVGVFCPLPACRHPLRAVFQQVDEHAGTPFSFPGVFPGAIGGGGRSRTCIRVSPPFSSTHIACLWPIPCLVGPLKEQNEAFYFYDPLHLGSRLRARMA